MQTSAIRLRVVDFLRQHSPFDSLPVEDLMPLCERGRVRFHESDEYIFWQQKPVRPLVYVLQRGVVLLLDESEGVEKLCDRFGPGDIFGADPCTGAAVYCYSARTSSETVLDAFHQGDFAALLQRHPHVRRYLDSHAMEGQTDPAAHRPGELLPLFSLLSPAAPGLCLMSDPAEKAAALLKDRGLRALTILDEHHEPAGLLTRDDFLDLPQPDARCGDLAPDPPLIFSPDFGAHGALLALASTGRSSFVVTADGTPRSPVLAALTLEELTQSLSAHPVQYLQQIRAAPDISTIRWLHRQARQAILLQLRGPESIDWLSALSHQLLSAILNRVLQLSGCDLVRNCWCFFGAAGRHESITAESPELALISTSEDAAREAAEVGHALTDCGFTGECRPVCGTPAAWQSRFDSWIAHPLNEPMQRYLGFFDLTPAAGELSLWRDVAHGVASALQRHPGFSFLLANEALDALPPLAVAADSVIEESGRESDRLDLHRLGIQPLTSLARALAHGHLLGFSTLERLRAAGAGPSAEQSFQVVLFHQARSGLRHGNAGFTISPGELSRLDRNALKAAFRVIHELHRRCAERQEDASRI